MSGNTELPNCDDCTPGYYCDGTGLTVETALCDAGFYCPAGQSLPTPIDYICPRGFKCPMGSPDPVICPRGQFVVFCDKVLYV